MTYTESYNDFLLSTPCLWGLKPNVKKYSFKVANEDYTLYKGDLLNLYDEDTVLIYGFGALEDPVILIGENGNHYYFQFLFQFFVDYLCFLL